MKNTRVEIAQTMASRTKRNSYTQGSRRNYFFGYPTDGKDGYSDCSSAVRESVRRILNFDIGSNTPAQVNNKKTLEWIEFANGKRYPTVQLEPGDLLYFKGSDTSRPYQVGHVEMVAENTAYLLGHGSGTGPRKISLKSYCYSRYKAGRGLIGVKRVLFDEKPEQPTVSSLGKRILKRTSPLMKGEDIRELQGLLLEVGYDCDGIDGYYGINTADAVRAFQFACRLQSDGEYGPLTHAALKAALEAGDLEEEEDAPDGTPRTLVATGDVWIRTLPSTAGGKSAVLHKGAQIERVGEDKYEKVTWACATYINLGKRECPARRIPEDILKITMTNVRVIPASAPIVSAQERNVPVRRRVTAYARVSTDSAEQKTSYDAQVDYYTKLIKSHPEWQYKGIYTDEGASAVNTKGRDGFNQMVKDGLAGKFDLIITKSVSRFARNTVDSLTTVRKLKEVGCEVWFEEQNIFTLDSKGELLITIMSSLAQEESRSISENVTWGVRKRMADGKFALPYKQFLGYEKGEDGLPKIVPAEAEIVRLIFALFMEGKTFSAIAKYLGDRGILSPAGKKTWQPAVVRSILTNEKYKGDALLQKTVCEDFLTKKMVKNNGRVQQFYVEGSHPAIIVPDEFDAVQLEIERRKGLGRPTSCASIFASKIVCADCGGWFGKKVWGSYKEDKTHRREIWRCNDKYKRRDLPGKGCGTPHITEDDVRERFLAAFNSLLSNRDGLIEDCRLARDVLCDTAAIDAELAELHREIEVVAELSRKAIYDNARNAVNQREWSERNDGYLERHRKLTTRVDELESAKRERVGRGKILEDFIRDIEKRPMVLAEFDAQLWLAVVDQVVVGLDGGMRFGFKNGVEIEP